MSVRLMIYEDHDHLRESLCFLFSISEGFEVVAAYDSYADVARQVSQFKPDVVLMDIDIPGLNGIEAVRNIRKTDAVTQLLMLTIFDDNQHVFDALSAGANGYLLKANITDRLIPAIGEVLSGGAPMSPSIARMVINSYQSQQKNEYNLTQRENEVLQALADGISYKLIADKYCISIDTVRTHIKRIYDKLHVRSQTEAVSKAIRERLV